MLLMSTIAPVNFINYRRIQTSGGGLRIAYVMIRDGAIVDHPFAFCDEDEHEVRSHLFQPGPAERAFLERHLQAHGYASPAWPVDVSALEAQPAPPVQRPASTAGESADELAAPIAA
jgi:hypothetical protein